MAKGNDLYKRIDDNDSLNDEERLKEIRKRFIQLKDAGYTAFFE